MSAPAASTTRSSRSRCRSRRRPAGGCWCGPAANAEQVRAGLTAGLVELCRRHEASSVHLTFLPEPECDVAGRRTASCTAPTSSSTGRTPATPRFDAFLEALSARKRKTIRRERREALAPGITVHWLTGSRPHRRGLGRVLRRSTWRPARANGAAPISRAQFYSLIGERMADKIVLIMAKRAGRWIAGAINFIGSDTLFGRHWGAIEHHPFLHFELCYYQAIEFAIEHKLKRVEAGAQGEHKLARGYLPVTTHSAHYIADPGLRRAVADYLVRERAYVEAAGEELAAAAPFRKDLAEQEQD